MMIKDLSMTEELDRNAMEALRGGIIYGPSPWEKYLPEFPVLPVEFPLPIRWCPYNDPRNA